MIVEIASEGETYKTPIGELEVMDASLIRWNSGKIYVRYLYKNLMQQLVKDMRHNIANGYDNLVVITGPEGSGKSNFAHALCHAYDSDFDLQEQYVYNTQDFKELLKKGGDIHGTFWMDEGSNMANNRDWNTTDNKQLVELLEMCRSRGWTLVICIPSMDRLDLYIRQYRVRYWIECQPMKFDRLGAKDRGYYELHKRTPYGKLSTVGYGLFEAMPDDAKKEYEALKLESQNKKIKDVTDGEKSKKGYQEKWADSEKKQERIMLQLHDSGMGKDELMKLFEIRDEGTYYNKITKAKKAAQNE